MPRRPVSRSVRLIAAAALIGLLSAGASAGERKPTFTKPAPVDLRHQIAAECGAVIEALAD